MFNLIYPTSNINILDHYFYFKTQRGRIKSQPINSEVSHYHLRLLLGNKEAPWWWPLKAPYGVFASLGRQIKAWVRGVGFSNVPSWVMEFKPGVNWSECVKGLLSQARRWTGLGAGATACLLAAWPLLRSGEALNWGYQSVFLTLQLALGSGRVNFTLWVLGPDSPGLSQLVRRQNWYLVREQPETAKMEVTVASPLERPVLAPLELHIQINFHQKKPCSAGSGWRHSLTLVQDGKSHKKGVPRQGWTSLTLDSQCAGHLKTVFLGCKDTTLQALLTKPPAAPRALPTPSPPRESSVRSSKDKNRKVAQCSIIHKSCHAQCHMESVGGSSGPSQTGKLTLREKRWLVQCITKNWQNKDQAPVIWF